MDIDLALEAAAPAVQASAAPSVPPTPAAPAPAAAAAADADGTAVAESAGAGAAAAGEATAAPTSSGAGAASAGPAPAAAAAGGGGGGLGAAQQVSRLQAQLALQDNGTWQITNLGRRAITVDGAQVRPCLAPGSCQRMQACVQRLSRHMFLRLHFRDTLHMTLVASVRAGSGMCMCCCRLPTNASLPPSCPNCPPPPPLPPCCVRRCCRASPPACGSCRWCRWPPSTCCSWSTAWRCSACWRAPRPSTCDAAERSTTYGKRSLAVGKQCLQRGVEANQHRRCGVGWDSSAMGGGQTVTPLSRPLDRHNHMVLDLLHWPASLLISTDVSPHADSTALARPSQCECMRMHTVG